MAFFEYCRTHNCIPDFLNLHYYDDTIEQLNIALGSTETRANILNTNENAFSEFLDMIYRELPTYFGKEVPVYMTEWNLPQETGVVHVREYFINRAQGSSFDTWVQMGAPKELNEEDGQLLEAHSAPGLYTHHENIVNHQLVIKTILEPLEVRFIEVQL